VSERAQTRPLVIAHRGASGYEPENTPRAYALAIAQCADMIEIDLHLTRDGAIPITHDEQIHGLGGHGEIADATLDQIQRLDAGAGQRVPLLDEVLDRFGAAIPFNLEIKTSTRGEYPGLEERVLNAVRTRGLLAATLFSSFSDRVLARLRELEPAARLAVLVSPRDPERPFERVAAVAAEALNPWHGLVDRELLSRAHGSGVRVFAYTVDPLERQRELIELGVDGLFTNYPDRMRALVDSRRS
jgi:glycerophosphoryl diester phosphodiesterase